MAQSLKASLSRLDWHGVVERLASCAQSEPGRQRCRELQCNLDATEVEERWYRLEAYRSLIASGYRPPVGELLQCEPLFKAAERGQIFDGEELRQILSLLNSTKGVANFASDFASRCEPLRHLKAQLYHLPKLIAEIERAVAEDGSIKDTASKELESIRRSKVNLRKKIEEQIRKMIHQRAFEDYLQDDFFTLRAERYVVPITLDGRGRIKGSIRDTSASGQTLFVEPLEIMPLNEQLLEWELNEKIEVLRILKEIAAHVAQEVDQLRSNYELLIDLDFHAAMADFAVRTDARPIKLSNQPRLTLVHARHPLLAWEESQSVVANTIDLGPAHRMLVVSGPNAGGKTVVLKTAGLLTAMAKAGLLIPAGPGSEIFLYQRIYVELGDSQNLSANLSTFSGHLAGLKPILESASEVDLILLDELAVGTEPQSGAALAQAMLERFLASRSTVLVTTHFDRLKTMGMNTPACRNASMDFDPQSLRPTYRLLLDIPGQSFALELAEQMGIDRSIIARAQILRGEGQLGMDAAIEELSQAKRQLVKFEEDLFAQKAHLEEQAQALDLAKQMAEQSRQKASEKLGQKYSVAYDHLRDEVARWSDLVKDALAQFNKAKMEAPELQKTLQALRQDSSRLMSEGHQQSLEAELGGRSTALPGPDWRPVSVEDIEAGDEVYVGTLHRKARVIKIESHADEPVELQIGALKMRHDGEDLYAQRREVKKSNKHPGVKPHPQKSVHSDRAAAPDLVPQSPTNTVNLRGMDEFQALDATWKFIDQAVLRGESSVILLHGHGTDKLKQRLRQALAQESPYKVRFRPGRAEEGGDGITIVFLIS